MGKREVWGKYNAVKTETEMLYPHENRTTAAFPFRARPRELNEGRKWTYISSKCMRENSLIKVYPISKAIIALLNFAWCSRTKLAFKCRSDQLFPTFGGKSAMKRRINSRYFSPKVKRSPAFQLKRDQLHLHSVFNFPLLP